MRAYTLIDSGFSIRLDLRLYEREAVIKTLYRYHDKYMISYEVEGNSIIISFETNSPVDDYSTEVSSILKELDFQMIRIDTIRRTSHIRELLVARSLYATCIEPEHDELEEEDGEDDSDWHEDQKSIFSSWSAEFE